ncbi:hypothetical protein G7Y89_g14728 [Cudoniella acicularis]|uniref:Uncharacterized protein n=1 Tax=Cudoniella acicularis TaxID=354080 RepID=A0A8H4R0D1_9HELO|nr:hypothetical protein G7Y89_g14728 [Cudoniella acicularis]
MSSSSSSSSPGLRSEAGKYYGGVTPFLLPDFTPQLACARAGHFEEFHRIINITTNNITKTNMMYTSTLTATLFLLLSAIPRTINAQQVADGLIVPFTSGLPACASVCGPLFDVQGACTPPNIAATSDSCFCSDARLTPISTDSGTTGVSQVCGTSSPESCTAASDLQAVKTWYSNFCSTKTGSTTTSSSGATAATGTGSSSATASSGSSSSSSGSSSGASQTWFVLFLKPHFPLLKLRILTAWRNRIQRTYPWVIMLVVITLAIVLGWIAACIFRRRYLRRKEREFEMRPPVVAWGPHQHQNIELTSTVTMEESAPLLRQITEPRCPTVDDPRVEFDPKGDPDNPLDWPKAYKMGIVFLLALMAFTV